MVLDRIVHVTDMRISGYGRSEFSVGVPIAICCCNMIAENSIKRNSVLAIAYHWLNMIGNMQIMDTLFPYD